MEFAYTIDPASNEPIMLITQHIGWDNEDGQGVDGNAFCRELMFLDTLNKSKINIWIHSEGGTVNDGEKIVAAILKSKTKIDTHNIGLCASIAGPIFLAGRERYMMDYAKFMMHPIAKAPDQKSYKAYEDSVVTMLSARIDLSDTVIRKMVNETTWLNAEQCGPNGLNICKIDYASEMNKPRKAFDPQNYSESLKEITHIVNKLITEKTPIKMKSVTNKLKLVDGANEESIVSAISEIENKLHSATSKLVTQETENKAKIDEITNKLTAAEKERDEVKVKLTEIENKAKTEAEKEAETKADERITNAVKLGKIENKAEVIAEYKALAKEKPELFDKLVGALPVNKNAPKINDITNKTKDGEVVVPYTAAGVMAKIAIQNKQTTI